MTYFRSVVTALVLGGLTACSTQKTALDQQIDDIFAVLTGVYAGEAPSFTPGSEEKQTIVHKFAPINAPQFGERVLYYQLTTGSVEGPVFQTKIFVFDLDEDRTTNRMAAFVFAPGEADGQLDQDPARILEIDPSSLATFPSACDLIWEEVGDGFKVSVKASDCEFQSAAFGQMIRPNMSYQVTGDRFEFSETLFGEDMTALVDTNGPLLAVRQ